MNNYGISPKAMSLRSSKNNKFTNKTSLPTYIPSASNSDYNSKVSLSNIFTIIKINFPQQYQTYINSTGILQQSFAQDSFQEHFNRILRQIKQETVQKVKNLQMQLGSVEMQLNLVRQSRSAGQEKIKKLQKQLLQVNEKLKGKQFDSYGKNQEIFQSKNRIQELQKQLIRKSLSKKQLCKQHEQYKRKMQKQINKYVGIKERLFDETQSNQNYLKQLERKLQIFKRQNLQYKRVNQKLTYQNRVLQEKNDQINERLDQLFIQSQNLKKISHQFNQCPNCNGNRQKSKMGYEEPLTNRSNPHFRYFLNNNKGKKALDSHLLEDNFHNRSRHNSQSRTEKPPPSTQQLLAEVKELRENQSILIDKLSERDQLIQSLSVSNNSLIT